MSIDIRYLSTFQLPARAHNVIELTSRDAIQAILENTKGKILVLGEGSNTVFMKNYDGTILVNKLRGIETVRESNNSQTLRIMAGENWHLFVQKVVKQALWGVENLAFIPGSCGAAPVQNIGAYGQQLSDTLISVEWYDFASKTIYELKKSQCNFGYRDSIFKHSLKDCGIILSITLKLSKHAKPNLTYPDVAKMFSSHVPDNPKEIADAITTLRQKKLYDPREIPNCGSFFKNVYLSHNKLQKLKNKYPSIPFYKGGSLNKVPTGWLIEQAGLKGYRVGGVAVSEKHALVLINDQNGSHTDLAQLIEHIQSCVQKKFGIIIEPEVNLIS